MPLPYAINVTAARSQGYHVRINDLWLRLSLGLDQPPLVTNEAPQAQRLDTNVNPEDFVAESGLQFSINDFTGGEGLDFAHRPGVRTDRFWDSQGIDVAQTRPGRPKAIRLLEALESVAGVTTAGQMANTSETLFVADGQSVAVVTNPAAATPTVSVEDPHNAQPAVDVLDVTVLGGQPYVALGASGVHQRTGTATWAHWSDFAATRVWEIKGRILGTTGTDVYEVKAAAASAVVITTDADITDVVDVGNFILISEGSYIHAVTFDEETLALTPTARTKLFSNETVTTMAFSPTGVLFVGTSESNGTGTIGRWYTATVTDSGAVTGLSLIREWGDGSSTSDHAPYVTLITRESAYTVIDEESVGPHLWRYDLGTGGRVRAQTLAGTGTSVGMAVLSDRIFVSQNSVLYREATTYAASGYIITPLFDHFTSRPKLWSRMTIDLVSASGALVELYASNSRVAINDTTHPTWTKVASVTSGTSNTVAIDIEPSRYMAMMVKMYSSTDNSVTPEVTSVSSQSYASGGDLVLRLPVNVSDTVHVRGRHRSRLPGLGRRILSLLYDLKAEPVAVELLDPPLTLRGTIESISTPIMMLSHAESPTLISQVVIRGTESTVLSLLTGQSGAFGTAHMFGTSPAFGEVG